MSDTWLPTGVLSSWGLRVSHRASPSDGGSWDPAAKPKVVWHTTEGLGVDSMANVLLNKNACSHFLIGRDAKGEPMRVVQFIGLDRGARALEHPAGTPSTNSAKAIQIEVAEFAINAAKWDDEFYKGLAALAVLIEHRIDIPRKVPRTFNASPGKPANRYTGAGFLKATGHVGHEHAASQPSGHWDPGKFNGRKLIKFMNQIDH